ncbi:MAG: transcription-repair coupling factor [Pseudomonadota bacterium]
MSQTTSVFDPPLPQPGQRAQWLGLPGSCAALVVSSAALRHNGPVLAICAGESQAQHLEQELRFFLGQRREVLHLPDTEVLPYDSFSPHPEILSGRLAALWRLPRLKQGVIVIPADALIQRLPPPAWLDGRAFLIKAGEKFDPIAFRQRLATAGYASVGEVRTQGEFALRGALLDVFPMGSEQAYRIDLFGDEIETLRVFDPETQRSTGTVNEIRLLPARDFPTDAESITRFRAAWRTHFHGDPSRSPVYNQVSKGLMPSGIESYLPLFFEQTAALTDYLPPNTLTLELGDVAGALRADWQQLSERHERYSGDIERPLLRPQDLFVTAEAALNSLSTLPGVAIKSDGGDFACGLIPAGAETVKQRIVQPNARTLFVAESAGRREALLAWLKPQGVNPRAFAGWAEFIESKNPYGITLGPLQAGLWLDDGIQLIAEAQIFGASTPAGKARPRRVRDPETLLRDLSDLRIDSPVVHVQHGVGRYKGLETLESGGITSELLVLEYAAGDRIYVPVASLGLIHRYTGADVENAPLHALGSDRWEKVRARAAARAHDVAAELLQVQARRAARPGASLRAPPEDYARFCTGFPFTPTTDQQKAIDEVLADLAREQPMDRVVCGDVGFGKTEVALRASFAAAASGRQVCVLAPTTLLAQQHFKNFSDRFAGWPFRIGALSRMRSDAEQSAMLDDLAEGRLDIVIGTHRLLQPDIRFKNLGLVVVDEEHRFGVRHKERLKNLRAEVDLLTLTATPIPRTLNMSLAGLRDLSIIATPPEGRLAIQTFIAEWNRPLIAEACQRELKRGGQIYYLHNEVRDIEAAAQVLRELLPGSRIAVAHGQMHGRALEQVMLDFYHQRHDILVCTTIIESGIDVPTANTLIVNRADELGLAQLHQLRGRVGRSHHRAYAYLLVPDKRVLKPDASKRLDAIEAMGELGSGFMLATHDLEIRGAGELLGESQHGQIEEVGFTFYADLLARAVRAIKSGAIDDTPFGAVTCEVDLGLSSLVPSDYVPDVDARLVLYKRIAEAASAEALEELKAEIADRFGPLPAATVNLFDVTVLRLRAEALGVVRLRVTARGITLDFAAQPKIDPRRIIRMIQEKPKLYRLEGQKRLHQLIPLEDPAVRLNAATGLLSTLSAA